MGNLDIPPKETTGPIRNENIYTQTFDDPPQFITTYQIKYFKKDLISIINTLFYHYSHFDMNPKGRDREGYVVGGIQKPRNSGFTEDTKTSNPFDNFRDERLTHYHLDPYQVRYIYSF